MIVKNKQYSAEKANDVANKILIMIQKESQNFEDGGDPAEQIYFLSHVLANLQAKICITLSGFGETYGIEKLSTSVLLEYVNTITKETIDLNSSQIDEIKNEVKDKYK